ncbi:IclR family transcriptional regulator [Primorskyibacter sp. 2E233]
MSGGAESKEAGGAQSVDRALSLLSLVGQGGGRPVSMTALTDATGLSRPTVRRLMLALMRAGMVEQDASSRHYVLGPEIYLLGLMARKRVDVLEAASDSLLRLAAESEDNTYLSVRRGSYAVCAHREEGTYPIRSQALRTGDCHPLGVGAGAMAMLAALPEPERAEVLETITPLLAQGYPGYTPEVVAHSIARSQDRGWALNPGLYLPNSWAIGMAIHGPDGEVLGALSIAAIDTRMQETRQLELAAMLRREVAQVEARLSKRMHPA